MTKNTDEAIITGADSGVNKPGIKSHRQVGCPVQPHRMPTDAQTTQRDLEPNLLKGWPLWVIRTRRRCRQLSCRAQCVLLWGTGLSWECFWHSGANWAIYTGLGISILSFCCILI